VAKYYAEMGSRGWCDAPNNHGHDFARQWSFHFFTTPLAFLVTRSEPRRQRIIVRLPIGQLKIAIAVARRLLQFIVGHRGIRALACCYLKNWSSGDFMPQNFNQWIELSLCFALIYVIFRPLVSFLDKIFES
jgi:hypothetical protein